MKYLLVAKFLLLVLLAVVYPCLAQPQLDSKQTFLGSVRERARRDAKTERPAQTTQDLHLLFGEEARTAGIPLRKVVEVYEETFAKSKPTKPLWDSFGPKAGWITAVVMAILLIFKGSLEKGAEHLIQRVQQRIYDRFAGSRALRRKALRLYREALKKKYEEIILPFRPDRPLQMREVYVPLKVRGGRDTDLVEAQNALARYKRLMVVGPPGSGKSMLLKSLTLAYAEGHVEGLPAQAIPILLELSRLKQDDRPISEDLVEVLRLNGFPRAERFVQLGLERGTLVLFLDGLDEVNSSQREAVVSKIRDLLDEFKDCRCVLTCRDAVYRNEFVETVEQTLDIVEFNDQQVRSFLTSWQRFLPADKSIEQLIQTLRDRPRIMALARNPLLLTIISFLYADTELVLPHSRAEFYERAIDILLRQWKGQKNRFNAPGKHLVLRQLALFNQRGEGQDGQDRRSIEYTLALQEVKQVLPALNLPDEEALPMLQEIVERSGLLLAIDGGTRYQFVHLTLQEFFTASALFNKPDELVDRFKADRDAWRETIKLWCGLDHDSTDLIRAVLGVDPTTAFECLADARQIDPELADTIVNRFQSQLGEAGKQGDSIGRAFASVASDVRPRGRAVFNFLVSSLDSSDTHLRTAAAKALSLTNLERAAQVLAERYLDQAVRPSLVRMGDLAVPFLKDHALQGQARAPFDLHAVGTPHAASALASLLWCQDITMATVAAQCLGNLLLRPEVENSLRDHTLTDEERKAELLDWVWKPFGEIGRSPLSAIAGRIAYLLKSHDPISKSSGKLEITPKIIVPLAVLIRAENSHAKLHWLIERLEQRRGQELLKRLGSAPKPTVSDWKNVFRPIAYKFANGIHYRVILLLIVAMSGVAACEMLLRLSHVLQLLLTEAAALGASLLSILQGWYFIGRSPSQIEPPLSPVRLMTVLVAPIAWPISVLNRFVDEGVNDNTVKYVGYFPLIVFSPSVIYFSHVGLKTIVGFGVATSIWGLVAFLIWVLYQLGVRKEREARNPLYGILDPPELLQSIQPELGAEKLFKRACGFGR